MEETLQTTIEAAATETLLALNHGREGGASAENPATSAEIAVESAISSMLDAAVESAKPTPQSPQPLEPTTPEESLRRIVLETITEVLKAQSAASAETEKLDAERRERDTAIAQEREHREALERKLNELVEENRRARASVEESERQNAIRSELQRLGVAKVELAFRAVKEDILRGEDGRLIGRMAAGEVPLTDYLKRFLEDNPELLPARIGGGSGASPAHRGFVPAARIDLDRIKPGMSPEELDQVRKEIVRVASQTFRG